MKRAIIIDDEATGINTLRLMLEKYAPAIRVVATGLSGEEGLNLIRDYQPDIVFLDVSMPGMSGFDLLEKLGPRTFKLVFTTAHPQFAVQAVRTHAFDYLLKPIVGEDLLQCVKGLLGGEELGPPKQSLLELSVKGGVIFLRPTDIIRLQAEGSYTTYFVEQGIKHVVARNLKDCSKKLDPSIFFRSHPSHIINLSKVTRMISGDGLYALMSDGSRAEISRKNKDLFLEKLKHL